MVTVKRPGVYVDQVSTRQIAGRPSSINTEAAFVGVVDYGPVGPVYVPSWSQFQTTYGAWAYSPSGEYLPYSVYMYFGAGASGCWISRVVSSTAVLASRTVLAAADNARLFTVKAISPGAWGNSLRLSTVKMGAAGSGLFDLIIGRDGAGGEQAVARHNNLSLNPSSTRFAPKVINGGSSVIIITDYEPLLGSTVPADVAEVASSPFSGGSAGGSIQTADYTDALDRLFTVGSSLVVNVPGSTDPMVNSFIAGAPSRGVKVFGVCDLPSGLTTAESIRSAAETNVTHSANLAVYYPWIKIKDPTVTSPGSTAVIPPGGAVVGQYISMSQTYGVHRTPAGLGTSFPGAIGLENPLTLGMLDVLQDSNINAIRQIPGSGVVIMGGRTHSDNPELQRSE